MNNNNSNQHQFGYQNQQMEDQPKLMRLNTISTAQPQQHNFQPQQSQQLQPQLYHQSKSINNPGSSVTTPGSKNMLKPKNSFGFNSGAQQQQQQQQISNNTSVRQSLLVRGNSGGGGMQIQSQNFQKLTDNLKNISNFINNGVGSSSGRQEFQKSSALSSNKMSQFRKNSNSFERDSRSGD